MELKISKEEMRDVLLEWAEAKFPGAFNAVSVEAGYSYAQSATFTKEDPAKVEA